MDEDIQADIRMSGGLLDSEEDIIHTHIFTYIPSQPPLYLW